MIPSPSILRQLAVVLCLALISGGILRADDAGLGYDIDDPPQGLFDEQWLEVFLQDQKIGYSHFETIRKGDLIHSSSYSLLSINRGPFVVSVETKSDNIETLDGKPVSFELVNTMGNIPITTKGTITDDVLLLETEQMGNKTVHEFHWDELGLMPWGFFIESYKRGLNPGTEYTLQVYAPETKPDGPVETQITVGAEESFHYRGKPRKGTPVTTTFILKSGKLESVSWVDQNGRALKNTMDAGGLTVTMYDTDQETALADFVPADVFESTLLTVERSIPTDARSVTYRVHFKTPLVETSAWPETDYQEILSSTRDEAVFRIKRAEHSGLGMKSADHHDKDLDEFLEDNPTLNTKDAELVKLARQASHKIRKPVILADELRRFTTDYISGKTLSVGFATASEVARNPSGDCTEHAVLLAALGRICGIPSRVASGIAYLPEYQGRANIIGFHMWTQFYLDGKWVDFDAALGESDCSPTRIAFHTSSLNYDSMMEMTLPMMKTIGGIEVDIIEIER